MQGSVLTKHQEPNLVYLIDKDWEFFLQIIIGEGILDKFKKFFFFKEIPYSIEGAYIKIEKTFSRNLLNEVQTFCEREGITLQKQESTNYNLE